MTQVPKPPKPKSIQIKTTITIPSDWEPKIKEYKEKHGFQDYAELFRHLLRKHVIGEN